MAFQEAGASSLEQFTLLAKNARGRACVALIQQALSNKKLFVFRELLDMANVQALRGTEHEGYLRLLEVFCFGNYSDYQSKRESLPELTPAQHQKLRKLSTVSLAQKSKVVPYEKLMAELEVSTIRDLEDILIDTIYSGLIQGKLDQKSKSLVVKFAVGRDTQDIDIDLMIEKLTKWKSEAFTICSKVDAILGHADGLAESEKTRDENIRVKNLRTLNERSKAPLSGQAASPHFNPDDFMIPDHHGRRGGPSSKRMPSGSHGIRKGRI